ncbi:MAG: 1-acyl-sn-glycerol-3-phosphate acyltransferase [Clostridiales bacterium]|nr:1-acyl-sn-glycerol-3-phosphate acyltransferase [Clostridiales bacterium]
MFGFLQWLVRVIYLPLLGVRVKGLENLEGSEGSIIFANHLSNNDIIILQVVTKQKLRIMAKEEVFKIKIFAPIMRWFGAFPVSRGNADRNALATAIKALKDGETFMIFPEGTRSKTGKLQRFMPGIAGIAIESGAPLIMASIKGKPRLFGKTEVTFHKKMDVAQFIDPEKKHFENIRAMTEALHEKMREALGE